MKNATPQKHVLVIRFSSLGDIILCIPAFVEVVGSGHQLTILTKEAYQKFLSSTMEAAQKLLGVSDVVQVLTISNKANYAELREKSKEIVAENTIDVVLDLHSNLRSIWLGWALCRLGMRKLPTLHVLRKPRLREWALFIFRGKIFQTFEKCFFGGRGTLLRWKRNVDFVRSALSISSQTPVFYQDRKFAEAFRKNSCTRSLDIVDWETFFSAPDNAKIIAFCPESAWSQKEWKLHRMVAVSRQMKLRGYRIVWLGTKELAEEFRSADADILYLGGRTSIEQLLGVLSRVHVLVCNDAGIMHLAELVNTPVVAIFGPTTHNLGFGPRLPRSQMVESNLWCRPCSKTGRLCFRVKKKQLCLELVDEQDVMRSIERVLLVADGEQS